MDGMTPTLQGIRGGGMTLGNIPAMEVEGAGMAELFCFKGHRRYI